MLGGIPADLREIEPFVAEPERSALLFDIDGTLAPIVADPEASAVDAHTRSLLAALHDRYGLVACISGRRAVAARRIVGVESLTYVGNHGLELLEPGADEAAVDPDLAPLAGKVKAFARDAYDEGLERLGVRLEDKDAIWAFHWRGAPDEKLAEQALGAVAEAAEREGLVPHRGRKVLEIRPTAGTDKGTAVETALDRTPVTRALYAGDDTTDLDAFRRLRELEADGRIEAVCVGVHSDEGPAAVLDEADVIVDGTEGVAELLEALA